MAHLITFKSVRVGSIIHSLTIAPVTFLSQALRCLRCLGDIAFAFALAIPPARSITSECERENFGPYLKAIKKLTQYLTKCRARDSRVLGFLQLSQCCIVLAAHYSQGPKRFGNNFIWGKWAALPQCFVFGQRIRLNKQQTGNFYFFSFSFYFRVISRTLFKYTTY